nr:ribonuclease H-like domain-containing protein [Tanacetum cinerariifolium]
MATLLRQLHLQILRDRALTELQRKLDLAETEKEGIQLNVNKLENASKSLNKIIECQIMDNYKKELGYNVVPPPHTGLFPPPKSNLSYTWKGSDAPIIEDWVSNDEEENVEKKEVKPSINRINFVKATTDNNPREIVKNGEQPKQNTHRKRGNQRNWNGMMSHRNHVPQAALTVNAARPINVVHPKRTMNAVNQATYFSKQPHSFVQRPNHKLTSLKNSYANKKVKTVWVKKDNTAKPKAAVNVAKAKAKHKAVKGKKIMMLRPQHAGYGNQKHKVLDHVSRHNNSSITLKKFNYGNPQEHLQDKGVIDSGCSRHMTENMSFLTDYEEIDGEYVAFRGNPNGGKITGKGTRDETSGTLKSFITRVENLMNFRKIIRCDNETEFKNKEMNQLCEIKGIMRQYSVARTPQQNRVAERRNMTLIEAARIMLADSKLPTTFWAKAVNTACHVQNRVLVTKPHNKTPYELFHGRTPTISFLRPFGYPVTILNTIDHLGKFDGKADEVEMAYYTLQQMFNEVRLQVDYEIEMAYDLLRLARKQLRKGYVS